jgi:hypothetical protein
MVDQPPGNTQTTDGAARNEIIVADAPPPMTPRAKLRQSFALATSTLMQNAVGHQQQTSSIAQAALTIGLQHLLGSGPIEPEGEAS